jgi:hypothetical protein
MLCLVYLSCLVLALMSRHRIYTSSINWAQVSRLLPDDGDRMQSPKLCVLNKKTGQWIMSKNLITEKKEQR